MEIHYDQRNFHFLLDAPADIGAQTSCSPLPRGDIQSTRTRTRTRAGFNRTARAARALARPLSLFLYIDVRTSPSSIQSTATTSGGEKSNYSQCVRATHTALRARTTHDSHRQSPPYGIYILFSQNINNNLPGRSRPLLAAPACKKITFGPSWKYFSDMSFWAP